MNKKLVALAVGGAFALPFAVQAQTANVTLYGRLNLDLEFVKGDTCQAGLTSGAQAGPNIPANCTRNGALGQTPAQTISNPLVNRVSSNSSRFGMRGTESLGGGLNAVFQIESNVSGDTGNASSSGLASRETFAGLQGGWGRVILGKFLMPMDDLHPIFGNATTFTTSILSTATVWAMGNLNKAQGGWDARTGNNIRYDSPNIMGFTAALQYSTRDDSGNTTQTPNGGDNGDHPSAIAHAYVIGGNIIYSNGPLVIAAGGEYNKNVRNNFALGGPSLHDSDWTIAASYNFGTLFQGFGLQIAAVYEQMRFNVQSTAPGAAAAGCLQAVGSVAGQGGTCSLERNFWGVSATVPIGAGKLYGFYGDASNGKGSAPEGTAVGYLVRGPNTSAKQWEITYTYALSPRTSLYGGYVMINNACKAAYTFNINAYPIAVGALGAGQNTSGDFCSGKPQGAVFGMLHTF